MFINSFEKKLKSIIATTFSFSTKIVEYFLQYYFNIDLVVSNNWLAMAMLIFGGEIATPFNLTYMMGRFKNRSTPNIAN